MFECCNSQICSIIFAEFIARYFLPALPTHCGSQVDPAIMQNLLRFFVESKVHTITLFTAKSQPFTNCCWCRAVLLRLLCRLSKRQQIAFCFELVHNSKSGMSMSPQLSHTYLTQLWCHKHPTFTVMILLNQTQKSIYHANWHKK